MSKIGHRQYTRPPTPEGTPVQADHQASRSPRTASMSAGLGMLGGMPTDKKCVAWLDRQAEPEDSSSMSKPQRSGSPRNDNHVASTRTASYQAQCAFSKVDIESPNFQVPPGFFVARNGQLIPKGNGNTIHQKLPRETDEERMIASCWAGGVHTPWYGKGKYDYDDDETEDELNAKMKRLFVGEWSEQQSPRYLKKKADIEKWAYGEVNRWRAENEASMRDKWLPLAKKFNEEYGRSDLCDEFEETLTEPDTEQPKTDDDEPSPSADIPRTGSSLFRARTMSGIATVQSVTPSTNGKQANEPASVDAALASTSADTRYASVDVLAQGPSRPSTMSRTTKTGRKPGYSVRSIKRKASDVEMGDGESDDQDPSKQEEVIRRPTKKLRQASSSRSTPETDLEPERSATAARSTVATSRRQTPTDPRRRGLARATSSFSLLQ
ncbi:hypothetical protein ONZ45_g13518 [Pleurotus djamor]|nr:hypothetical protein ONZ45_g13518 [Pleurotus djamor]